jgi:hypothetical protein
MEAVAKDIVSAGDPPRGWRPTLSTRRPWTSIYSP